MSQYTDKKVIVFDLDGTLTESKSVLESDMSELIGELLLHKMVAVISGGAFPQFKTQFLSQLNCDDGLLGNLFLFPTDATSLYKYEGGEWRNVYEETLAEGERKKIIEALEESLDEVGYKKQEKT